MNSRQFPTCAAGVRRTAMAGRIAVPTR